MNLLSQKQLKELEREIKEIFDDFYLSLEQVLPYQEKQAKLNSLKQRVENWIKKLKRALSRNGEEINLLIPPADVLELSDQYKILLDLPGVGKDELQVLVKDQELYIKAKKTFAKLGSKEEFIAQESGPGEYFRKLQLPDEIDQEKIQAQLKNGVLEIILPKKAPSQVRTVEVFPA